MQSAKSRRNIAKTAHQVGRASTKKDWAFNYKSKLALTSKKEGRGKIIYYGAFLTVIVLYNNTLIK